jgi:hypothetical protein
VRRMVRAELASPESPHPSTRQHRGLMFANRKVGALSAAGGAAALAGTRA